MRFLLGFVTTRKRHRLRHILMPFQRKQLSWMILTRKIVVARKTFRKQQSAGACIELSNGSHIVEYCRLQVADSLPLRQSIWPHTLPRGQDPSPRRGLGRAMKVYWTLTTWSRITIGAG